MAYIGIRTSHLRFRTAVTPDQCIIQHTDSADLNSARHAQFQEKEKTPTTELNIFFSKNFFEEK